MIRRFLWTPLLLLLLTFLSACAAAPVAQTPVSEEPAAEVSEPVPPEEEAPDSEGTLRALAEAFPLEEEFAPFMTPDTSIELGGFTYGDFDGDGVHEAFARKDVEYVENINRSFTDRAAAAWIFVRPDGCELLEVEQETFSSLRRGTLDGLELFLFSGSSVSDTIYSIYRVKDSRAVRLVNPARELAALVSPER
ncbi:MAG: hypothetical protein LBR98_00430, partial [Syntrophomonadaceae bacterium]|nr:hypothetical protein [Syntrophomonadaceae bacterium]